MSSKKVRVSDSEVHASSNITTVKDYGVEMNAKMFSALTDNLYTNKPLAVVRETCCNAFDAHVDAGKADVPYDVKLPNDLDAMFVVRDYGLGLDEDSIYALFSTLGASTKEQSTNQIGAWGLGSKSPFALSESFVVTSYNGGMKKVYTCAKQRGKPQTFKMSEEKSDEPSGLQISVPIRSDVISRFNNTAIDYFSKCTVRPNISGIAEHRYEDLFEREIVQISDQLSVWSHQSGTSSIRFDYSDDNYIFDILGYINNIDTLVEALTTTNAFSKYKQNDHDNNIIDELSEIGISLRSHHSGVRFDFYSSAVMNHLQEINVRIGEVVYTPSVAKMIGEIFTNNIFELDSNKDLVLQPNATCEKLVDAIHKVKILYEHCILRNLASPFFVSQIKNTARSISYFYETSIGDITLPPSREMIEDTPENAVAIIKTIEQINVSYNNLINKTKHELIEILDEDMLMNFKKHVFNIGSIYEKLLKSDSLTNIKNFFGNVLTIIAESSSDKTVLLKDHPLRHAIVEKVIDYYKYLTNTDLDVVLKAFDDEERIESIFKQYIAEFIYTAQIAQIYSGSSQHIVPEFLKSNIELDNRTTFSFSSSAKSGFDSVFTNNLLITQRAERKHYGGSARAEIHKSFNGLKNAKALPNDPAHPFYEYKNVMIRNAEGSLVPLRNYIYDEVRKFKKTMEQRYQYHVSKCRVGILEDLQNVPVPVRKDISNKQIINIMLHHITSFEDTDINKCIGNITVIPTPIYDFANSIRKGSGKSGLDNSLFNSLTNYLSDRVPQSDLGTSSNNNFKGEEATSFVDKSGFFIAKADDDTIIVDECIITGSSQPFSAIKQINDQSKESYSRDAFERTKENRRFWESLSIETHIKGAIKTFHYDDASEHPIRNVYFKKLGVDSAAKELAKFKNFDNIFNDHANDRDKKSLSIISASRLSIDGELRSGISYLSTLSNDHRSTRYSWAPGIPPMVNNEKLSSTGTNLPAYKIDYILKSFKVPVLSRETKRKVFAIVDDCDLKTYKKRNYERVSLDVDKRIQADVESSVSANQEIKVKKISLRNTVESDDLFMLKYDKAELDKLTYKEQIAHNVKRQEAHLKEISDICKKYGVELQIIRSSDYIEETKEIVKHERAVKRAAKLGNATAQAKRSGVDEEPYIATDVTDSTYKALYHEHDPGRYSQSVYGGQYVVRTAQNELEAGQFSDSVLPPGGKQYEYDELTAEQKDICDRYNLQARSNFRYIETLLNAKKAGRPILYYRGSANSDIVWGTDISDEGLKTNQNEGATISDVITMFPIFAKERPILLKVTRSLYQKYKTLYEEFGVISLKDYLAKSITPEFRTYYDMIASIENIMEAYSLIVSSVSAVKHLFNEIQVTPGGMIRTKDADWSISRIRSKEFFGNSIDKEHIENYYFALSTLCAFGDIKIPDDIWEQINSITTDALHFAKGAATNIPVKSYNGDGFIYTRERNAVSKYRIFDTAVFGTLDDDKIAESMPITNFTTRILKYYADLVTKSPFDVCIDSDALSSSTIEERKQELVKVIGTLTSVYKSKF